MANIEHVGFQPQLEHGPAFVDFVFDDDRNRFVEIGITRSRGDDEINDERPSQNPRRRNQSFDRQAQIGAAVLSTRWKNVEHEYRKSPINAKKAKSFPRATPKSPRFAEKKPLFGDARRNSFDGEAFPFWLRVVRVAEAPYG